MPGPGVSSHQSGTPEISVQPASVAALAVTLAEVADVLDQTAQALESAVTTYQASCASFASPLPDVDATCWATALQHRSTAEHLSQFVQAAEAADVAHPFFEAAAATGDLPFNRVALLLELDRIAAMPLPDFVALRSSARIDAASLDWTSDGCSGPIPAEVADTCLRHDFLYRNARKLRDLLGLSPAFAERVKSHADQKFGRELRDGYEPATLVRRPELALWLYLAQRAVTVFGDVSEPWSPPASDQFYGSTDPGSGS